jgi:hypothetical protein
MLDFCRQAFGQPQHTTLLKNRGLAHLTRALGPASRRRSRCRAAIGALAGIGNHRALSHRGALFARFRRGKRTRKAARRFRRDRTDESPRLIAVAAGRARRSNLATLAAHWLYPQPAHGGSGGTLVHPARLRGGRQGAARTLKAGSVTRCAAGINV